MKIEDYKKVSKIVEVRTKIQEALAQIDNYVDRKDEDDQYWCHLSTHADGSGSRVDMRGCYVASEMGRAAKYVLEEKLKSVEAELVQLGVDVGE